MCCLCSPANPSHTQHFIPAGHRASGPAQEHSEREANRRLLQPPPEIRARWTNAINGSWDTASANPDHAIKMLTFARTWRETNPWTRIRTRYPPDQVHFLSSKTFLLPPYLQIQTPLLENFLQGRHDTLWKIFKISLTKQLSQVTTPPRRPSRSHLKRGTDRDEPATSQLLFTLWEASI